MFVLQNENKAESFKKDFKQFLNSAKDLLFRKSKKQSQTLESYVEENQLIQSHPIVEKPNLPFIFADSSNYFTVNNKMNPIDKHLNTVMLSIDTLFRPNYFQTKSTDFIYTLPVPLKNIASMQLTSMELPRNFYEFSASLNNNYFTINLYNMCYQNLPIPNVSHKIEIPDGNYTHDKMQNVLNNYFLNIGGGLDFLTVNIDSNTSKTIIRVSNPYDLMSNPNTRFKIPYNQKNDMYNTSGIFVPGTTNNDYYSPDFYFEVDFTTKNTHLYENMGWMLGFTNPKYSVKSSDQIINYIFLSTGTVVFKVCLVSESSYGSSYTNYLFLEIDDYNNNNQVNTIYANNNSLSFISNNILARISLNNVAYTIIQNNAADNVTKKREYYGPIRLEKLRIRLLNKYGKVVDMVNNNYSFVLELKQIYS
jgi:hypothetical protein